MSLLSSSTDTAKYKETQNQLNELKEALNNYYIQFGRLPCPDTGVDGIEESSCVTGGALRGFLPHVTLGLGGSGDAWGERFKYVVSPKFTTVTTPPATPAICTDTTPRTISPATDAIVINDLQATPQKVAEFSAFALLSTGKNGRQTNSGMTGAFTNNGGCSGLNTLEQENCDSDSILRSGLQRTDGNTVVFDDIVVWASDVQLVGLLKKSGMCIGAISNNNNNNPNPSPPPDSNSGGGCTVAQSGNDFGLIVMLLTAIAGIWLKFSVRQNV
jgi:type II secretory pathway pseudopilin PulG